MVRSWRRIALLTLGSIAVVVLSFSTTLFILQNLNDNSPIKSLPGVSFVIDPAILRDCDPPIVAKLSWNVSIAGVKTVRIFLLVKDKGEVLFRQAGVVGSVNTDPWVAANTVMVLRDGDSMKQLAKFTVGSKSCN
jgi:hypothetical protein